MNLKSKKNKATHFVPMVLTISTAIMIMTFQLSFSAIVDLLEIANNLSRFKATILITSPSFFIVVLSSFSGRLLDRVNPIKLSFYCLIASVLLSTAGLFVHGFWNILALRLAVGIPFAPLLVMALQLPQIIYPKNLANRMVTIQTLGAPIGAIIMLFCGAWIGVQFGYTYTYFVSILFGIIGMISSMYLFELKIPRKPVPTKKKPTLKPISKILAFSWMFFTGSTSIFLFLGTELGKSHGLPLLIAVSGSAFLMIPPLVISPVAGEVMDKKISRFTLMVFSSILMIIAFQLLWISKATWVVGAILLGSSAAIIPPIIFSAPARFEKPENIGYLVGRINMYGTLGMLLIPPLAGLVNDLISGWWLPMVFAGFLVSGITLVGLTNKRSLS